MMLSMHVISILYIHGVTSYTVKQPAPLASHYVKAGGPLSYSIPFCVCCALSYATPFYVVLCLIASHSVLYIVLCYRILCCTLSYTYPHSVLLFTPGNLRYSPYSIRSHDCVSYDVYNTYLYPCTYTCQCIQTST